VTTWSYTNSRGKRRLPLSTAAWVSATAPSLLPPPHYRGEGSR
jgi:hypothetical protein